MKSNIYSNFPIFYKFLFRIVLFLFGISSEKSANYIIENILNNNSERNNKFFNFNSKNTIKDLDLNKKYSKKIWDIFLDKKLKFEKL